MITHQQFLDDWLGNRYRETVQLGYQCVASNKLYYELVYGITGLSFGGSAANGFNKKGNLQDFLDYVTIPQQGDMVFFKPTPTNLDGHTGIYHDQKTLLEQNGGAGSGTGLGKDAIRLATMPKNILGYMRWRETETDKRVRLFADRHNIKGRSKTQPYTQFETLSIISLFHE